MMMHNSRRAALLCSRTGSKQRFCQRKLHVLSKEALPHTEALPFSKEWDFHLIQNEDLSAVCSLILESIDLNDNDFGVGGISIFNGPYIKLGLLLRSRQRLADPSLEPSSNSFVLAATPKGSHQIAAIVEIMLIEDGELPPFLSNYFRSLKPDPKHEPYLYNLCVKKVHQRKGLGKLICELAQELVQIHWKKNTMNLHVLKYNTGAQHLYEGMGYKLMWTKKIPEAQDDKESIMYYSLPLQRLWPRFTP